MKSRYLMFGISFLTIGWLLGQTFGSRPSARVTPVIEATAVGSARVPSDSRTPHETRLDADESRTIEIFDHASAALVNITSVELRRNFLFDVYRIPQGAGTGFFWDRDGHIVTNYHVIEGADRISVTLADGSDWDAELVGVAPDKDIAVLHVDLPQASRVEPLRVGVSRGLRVGQKVLALGNPFGLDQTLTVGVLSALGRELASPGGRTIRDVIQTDAAINPGNSGGPLLDSNGNLIGMNTAIYSPSGGSAGIGFAVPVDIVARLVPQLIEFGRPIEPGLPGAQWLNESFTKRWGLTGAVLRYVEPRSAAASLGLEGLGVTQRGRYVVRDVVVAVDGKAVRSPTDLRDAFEDAGLGQTVTLTVRRDGRDRSVVTSLDRLL